MHDIVGMLSAVADIDFKINIGQHADIRRYNNW